MSDLPSPRRNVVHVVVASVRDGVARSRPETLATEEPMEVRLAGPGRNAVSIAVTMRTPSADFELAVGFLFSSGLIGANDVVSVRYCELPADDDQRYNIVTVQSRRAFEAPTPRAFAVNASCGLCGTASLEELAGRCPVVGPGPSVAGSVIVGLPVALRAEQRIFRDTGGLHGAGLFTAGGTVVAAREDVGRHNAVDKIVGYALLAGLLPLGDQILMVSGRVSFEIVEKAAMAGIAVVGAVSAPTSLAVDAAHRFGVTLVGFLREDHYNVYTHPERVDSAL
jgi:FdhD protein